MLRPERMSKVSVTGAKAVMPEVVETIHEANLLHLTDYAGAWDGFDPGDPAEGAEPASEKLVTVRSLKSILDLDAEDEEYGPKRIVDEDELAEELEAVRQEVNELDDRRNEVNSEYQAVAEQIEAMEPFATLGIDLDLLWGYDSLQVEVGEGDAEAVEQTVEAADEIDEFELFAEDGVIAIFAYPTEDASADALSEALVGVEFTALEVPEAEGAPETYISELEAEREELAARLDEVQAELDAVRDDVAGFLLAAEEKLAIDVQKTGAPLSFATTDNAFVAEGWIPADEYEVLADALDEAVGDRVEVEELKKATYGRTGETPVRERFTATAGGDHDGAGPEASITEAGADTAEVEAEARTDGGTGENVVMRDDAPPVIQNNPGVVRPFELFVKAVNRPQYTEFDPTVFLFLTFPAFFGFMIGDLGYGIIYTGIGYFLYDRYESPGFKSMGGVTIWAGLFTMLFGILYGEIFGLHLVSEYLWEGLLGLHGPPIEKGLSPAGIEWAKGWLIVSVLAGIFHLNVGYVLDFLEGYEFHDFVHALEESGSWMLMMNGLWIWVLSAHAKAAKPDFLFTTFSGEPFAFGFAGFPAVVGLAGLAAFGAGFVLLAIGEPIEVVEFLNVLVNVLSYTRLAAVLLAKAGMAFTVNLLFFGAYLHDGEFHFMLGYGPEHVIHEYGREAILFPGMMHSGIAGVLGGLVVLVLGQALVLALGVTSAGLQAVRLEYVEFFGKFFEGGGRTYNPFGYARKYTADE